MFQNKQKMKGIYALLLKHYKLKGLTENITASIKKKIIISLQKERNHLISTGARIWKTKIKKIYRKCNFNILYCWNITLQKRRPNTEIKQTTLKL